MSLFDTFRRGLQRTATVLHRSIETLFTSTKAWDEDSYKKLEGALVSADIGFPAAKRIAGQLQERYNLGKIKTGADILKSAAADVAEIAARGNRPLNTAKDGPTIILVVGVNGAGKTTTIGKMAARLKKDGFSVMLGACDTFRAAAIDQLKLWGQRVDVPVIASTHGSDAAATAFDACTAAKARNIDFLIIDTAGRQHTRADLMEELPKLLRVLRKVIPEGPHETLLVVDGSTGTNALHQAREFGAAVGVTGLCVTKLDGAGKGGVVVAIKEENPLPVFFVGLGEQPGDLEPFDAETYSKALFDLD